MIVLPAAELEAAQAALWYDDRRQGLGDEFLDHARRRPDYWLERLKWN
ncbi:MAG TPA: hypothetical protein VMV10_26450 [Pirellulales bacterium]|nr:hypothetical protein [Pirellulales bacterium]